MKTFESEEMYLETIYLLRKRSDYVRSVHVAEELGYSRPSVSRAVNLLSQKGYISIDKNGSIRLTEVGERRALDIYERHRVITELLTMIGADAEVAEENACRIEHVITPELFEILKKYSAILEQKF